MIGTLMASPRLQCGKGLPVWHGRKNIGGSQKNAWRWRARPRASACEPRFYKWRRSGFGRDISGLRNCCEHARREKWKLGLLLPGFQQVGLPSRCRIQLQQRLDSSVGGTRWKRQINAMCQKGNQNGTVKTLKELPRREALTKYPSPVVLGVKVREYALIERKRLQQREQAA